jgi:hypothetical protein
MGRMIAYAGALLLQQRHLPSKYSSTQSHHSEMFYAEKTTWHLKEEKNRKDTGLNRVKKDWVM